MTDGIFVRALWGFPDYAIRAKIEREAREAVACKISIPTRWYVYGECNRDFLADLGVNATMLDPEPICRFGRTGERKATDQTNYGVSQWRHKYDCLRHALETFPDAVWLDFDTMPVKPLPRDFWQRMRRGREFQCSLQQNTRKRAGWRGPDCTPEQFARVQEINKRIAEIDRLFSITGYLRGAWEVIERLAPEIAELEQLKAERRLLDKEPRKTPCGSLMYFRGRATVDRFIALYEQRPHEWDLTALARFTDELWGGWQHSSEYKTAGFEPPFHNVGRQVFQPEEVVFKSGWKRGLRAVAKGKVA